MVLGKNILIHKTWLRKKIMAYNATAQYHAKRRTLEAGKRNPYNPGQIKHGKWITQRAFDTYAEAKAFVEQWCGKGLYEWSVYYKHKTVVCDMGRMPATFPT